jgi:biopolymer transport protein ExbD
VDDIVISVLGNGTVRLNQETVATTDLDARLKEVFKYAANHVIFVRAEKGLDFRYVAEVIDIAKGAGLDRVALMTQ